MGGPERDRNGVSGITTHRKPLALVQLGLR